MFKAQKGSKDIVKIVHVKNELSRTVIYKNRNVMKQREYLLCTKKTKRTTLFNNFFSSVSVFDTLSGWRMGVVLLMQEPGVKTYWKGDVDKSV